ncbi:MAG: hypothetical protein LBL93_04785, partial [Ruminococcus sp.]|nr:hypothetical protein [Ruminococcus sp.]
CFGKIPDNAEFCSFCGAELKSSESSLKPLNLSTHTPSQNTNSSVPKEVEIKDLYRKVTNMYERMEDMAYDRRGTLALIFGVFSLFFGFVVGLPCGILATVLGYSCPDHIYGASASRVLGTLGIIVGIIGLIMFCVNYVQFMDAIESLIKF